MKNEQAVKAAFEYAAERYAAIGVDVNEVLKKMQGISLSLHCWQTDDVSGFENPDGKLTIASICTRCMAISAVRRSIVTRLLPITLPVGCNGPKRTD